ncbi:MAG: diguanylate cyclase, partial [Burkholderiales bacterium]|nr:diguanylate cyclase [Burkholderiales bacterium]
NQAAQSLSGFSAADVLGKTPQEAFPAAMADTMLQRERALLSGPSGEYRSDEIVTRQDGSICYLHTVAVPLRNEAGQLDYILCIAEDVTRRRDAESALRESESRLRTITNTMPAMVAYLDAQEHYRFYNRAYEKEIGINMARADGKTVLEVVGPERYKVISPYIRRVLAGEVVEYEDDVSRDGVFRVLLANYIPQYAEDGTTVIGFHVMRQDITAQKLEEQRLLQLAQLDVLTGLSNRAGFMQKLRDAMTHCRQHGGLIGLMYMDIDFFKAVNDTHGHHVGDLLLSAFAQRLCHSLRTADSVARLGGDEFTVIMHNLARTEDAHAIADKVVQVMQQSFVLEELELHVSASIGLAYFAGGDASAEALMNQADMMLYSAKRSGRNTWRAAPLALHEN